MSQTVPATQFASSGARGLIAAGLGIAAEHAEFKDLRDAFLKHYEAEICVDSRLFPGMEDLLGSLEARGTAWGVVTNKFERFARPVPIRILRQEHERQPEPLTHFEISAAVADEEGALGGAVSFLENARDVVELGGGGAKYGGEEPVQALFGEDVAELGLVGAGDDEAALGSRVTRDQQRFRDRRGVDEGCARERAEAFDRGAHVGGDVGHGVEVAEEVIELSLA